MARTNVELLDEALSEVESDSVRNWANSAHNRPLWEKIAQRNLDKNPDTDVLRFSAYIVCQAMGM